MKRQMILGLLIVAMGVSAMAQETTSNWTKKGNFGLNFAQSSYTNWAAGYPLWTLPEDELRRHPYIDSGAAHGIVLYREHNPSERWTVEGLKAAGVLRPADADRLARCRIATP